MGGHINIEILVAETIAHAIVRQQLFADVFIVFVQNSAVTLPKKRPVKLEIIYRRLIICIMHAGFKAFSLIAASGHKRLQLGLSG